MKTLIFLHRNPLRAGLADSFDTYVWSNRRGYVSRAKRWKWLDSHYVAQCHKAAGREGLRIGL